VNCETPKLKIEVATEVNGSFAGTLIEFEDLTTSGSHEKGISRLGFAIARHTCVHRHQLRQLNIKVLNFGEGRALNTPSRHDTIAAS